MATRAELQGRVRAVVDIWVDAFAEHDLLAQASAIAFQVLKSLIPLSLLAIAILGASGRRDIWTDHIAPAIQSHLDPPVYHAIDYAVNKIFAHNSRPLIVFASLLAVWYISGAVRAIMGGINRIYEADETRPFWHRWLLSFALSVCVLCGIAGAALLIAAVPTPSGSWAIPALAARWLAAIALLALVTGLLVRFAPAERRSKKWASAGAVLVIVTWIVTTLVFDWYVGSIANFKTAIGQLTVFIVLMVYFYASSIVFLVGVQLDELLREDARADERGILHILLGLRR